METPTLKNKRVICNDPLTYIEVAKRCGILLHYDAVSSIGIVDTCGNFCGGWLFEQYTGEGGSVHIHWAGDIKTRWFTRSLIELVSNYVFVQLKCRVAFGRVKSTDYDVRSMDERLGFKEHCRLPGYFPDADLIVYQMKATECKWLPRKVREALDG